ncbi:AAA family ATPase [Acetobacterium wieringae]|uniref:AAA family ATPase n=1 Tax=Acetobacterium wieringae TaxID=52694 RepID=UPI0020344F5E|nr:AAA family ATPase [Acetobacterium wieringae]URN86153.1 AAA family ATPase [Acetobacterium wieringae]
MMLKINKLEIENVKRIKAVKIEPTLNGLTIVGGKNNQGKTSVLDSISWALGGEKYRPSQAQRDGSVLPPNLHIVMNNGLVVERKGKNSDLKVIDPDGKKAGQQLLNEFVEQLAIDLPKFMESSSKDKANTLLQIIGVGDKLYELEKQEQEVYNKRLAIGQIADQKKKFAKEMTYYPDAPKEPISAGDLIKQQQDILARNGENQRKREKLSQLEIQKTQIMTQIAQTQKEIEILKNTLNGKTIQYNEILSDIEIAQKSVLDLKDESTEELEKNINDIDAVNRKVRANLDKDKAEEDALEYENQYKIFTSQIDTIRQSKIDLLKGAPLPLPGLSVVDGELVYMEKKWDNMSGSDQLKVSTAIVRKLNPKCGFVLLDKLEQMDLDTLKEFGEWLEAEGLQAIATRVSTGEECQIIIEDGYVAGAETLPEVTPESTTETKWKAGEF